MNMILVAVVNFTMTTNKTTFHYQILYEGWPDEKYHSLLISKLARPCVQSLDKVINSTMLEIKEAVIWCGQFTTFLHTKASAYCKAVINSATWSAHEIQQYLFCFLFLLGPREKEREEVALVLPWQWPSFRVSTACLSKVTTPDPETRFYSLFSLCFDLAVLHVIEISDPVVHVLCASDTRDNWCTVGGDGGCRVGEVRAGTTTPMPDHKGF